MWPHPPIHQRGPLLACGLADHPENYTRFWVVARESVVVAADLPARTSLLLVTDHREGALVEALQSLAEQRVNMTRLESRPVRGVPWQYAFFLDLEGNWRRSACVPPSKACAGMPASSGSLAATRAAEGPGGGEGWLAPSRYPLRLCTRS